MSLPFRKGPVADDWELLVGAVMFGLATAAILVGVWAFGLMPSHNVGARRPTVDVPGGVVFGDSNHVLSSPSFADKKKAEKWGDKTTFGSGDFSSHGQICLDVRDNKIVDCPKYER